MVTLLLLTAAWILAALATGVGVGRIIARADVADELPRTAALIPRPGSAPE